MHSLRLTRGSKALIAICTLDMLTTLYLVLNGMAVEFNPIMNKFFEISPAAFVFAKLFSFIPFIVAIEKYKKYNPRFTSYANRITVAAYLMIYFIMTIRVNF